MADPVVPNYINGIGRLATDRYTYEKHVNGTDDRHKANQIDLFPTVVIGTPQSTVQDAIAAISTVIGTPPADASTTVKGIVKLAGDIAGTATSVVVTRLQGKPISSLVPTSGDVLTWDGSTWKPQSISGTFANLNVSGNTILGTNSSNTLVVNAQATLSNNLNVNGNTVLGNANTDSTSIQGILTQSGGDISLTGLTNTTLNSNGSLNIAGTTSTTLVSGGSLSLLSTGITNITAPTLNLKGTAVVIPSTTSTFTISPSSYTSFNGNVQQATGTFSFFTGSQFYIFSGVSCTINSNLIMGGSAKINKKFSNGPNSNSSIYPALYDVYFCGGITGDHQWTIDETTYPATQVGIDFEVINNSAYNVTIYSPSPDLSTIVFIGSGQAATIYRASGTRNWQLKCKYNII